MAVKRFRKAHQLSQVASLAFSFLLASTAFTSLTGRGSLRSSLDASSLQGYLLQSTYRQPQVALFATSVDTFDPWTALEISPNSGQDEARKAYKKLIAKFHPDVDPSPSAAARFQQVVRAYAIITGEDKNLDVATLLDNAVNNLRNDLEFQKTKIERLKQEALEAELKVQTMEAQLGAAEEKRDKVTSELGLFGGAALGLLVAGPAGLVVGALLGSALSKRDDAIGKVIRGTGSAAKGAVDAVGKVIVSNEK